MKHFADLYARLDATTSSNSKLAALQDYFVAAAPEDAAWAVYFLAGGRPRQLVSTKVLRALALEASGVSEWLFEESYQAVGDLAETISLLLPEAETSDHDGLAVWMQHKLLPLRGTPPDAVVPHLLSLLRGLDRQSQLVCIKLITGSFRVGVSKLLVTRALAALSGIDAKRIAQRMVGYTDVSTRPTAAHYLRLIAITPDGQKDERDLGQPYPFFLAHPLALDTTDFEAQIGPASDWQVEWKWDGIRTQLVKRGGQLWVWSRGEELVTDRFPELGVLAQALPNGTVIDGELVAVLDGQVQPFGLLQQRIGRKVLSAAVLKKVPVAVLAYDLLEWQGHDQRQAPQHERRTQLEQVVTDAAQATLTLSPLLHAASWSGYAAQREQSRSRGVEGLMLKARNAHYGVGRTKDVGVWLKWKIEPYRADAVLIYAQRGHGRRASLYTDFTFAVWDAPDGTSDRKLVPFAKAYSGLSDEEMRQVDAVIRKTTIEQFGPVRSVIPTLVFELGFEGIGASPRHKSGIAVRFPRMLRWRLDKPVAEADTLDTLRALMPPTSVAA